MKKFFRILVIALFCASLMGCYTFKHKVGTGASANDAVKKKQWFILWGLVPLNQVDTQALAGGATNYDIKTQQAVDDWLISIVSGMVTVYPRTVTVTK